MVRHSSAFVRVLDGPNSGNPKIKEDVSYYLKLNLIAIHLATTINQVLTKAGQDPGVKCTYYWGNTPAVDLINLWMNEGEEYSSPLALLLCGVGDPRNVLLTIASLPDAYKQQTTFVLNDICPYTLARTVLLLYMPYKGKVLSLS